jgi:hypothetical protein
MNLDADADDHFGDRGGGKKVPWRNRRDFKEDNARIISKPPVKREIKKTRPEEPINRALDIGETPSMGRKEGGHGGF